VDCHSRERLSAHHICRKSFLAEAQFQTGNGITLCSTCHREMHQGFNARPDLSVPVDAQGGEKLAAMERLYSILTDDAVERGLMREDFYFLLNGEARRAATELAEARGLSSNDRYSSIARLKALDFWAPKARALLETTYFTGLRKAGMPEK
jgi:hypothetical protein